MVHPHTPRIFKNTAFQLVTRFVAALSAFVFSLFVGRQFGATGFGEYSLITSLVVIWFLAIDFSLNATYIARIHEKASFSWSTLFFSRLYIALGLVGVLFLFYATLPSFISAFSPTVLYGVLLFLPLLVIQGIAMSANAHFQQKLTYSHATIATIVGSLTSLCLLGTAIYTHTAVTIHTILLMVLLGAAVTSAVSLLLVFIHGTSLFPLPSKTHLQGLFMASVPLGLTLLFTTLYNRADTIILGFTRPASDVGIYALAYRFFEFPLYIPTFYMNAVYPLLLKREKDSPLVSQAYIFLFIAACLCTIGVWVGAPLLSLIRHDFAQSTTVLRILSLGYPSFFLSNITMWLFVVHKKHRQLLFLYAAATGAILIAYTFGITVLGYIAAAWITVIAETLVLGLSYLFLRKHRIL